MYMVYRFKDFRLKDTVLKVFDYVSKTQSLGKNTQGTKKHTAIWRAF